MKRNIKRIGVLVLVAWFAFWSIAFVRAYRRAEPYKEVVLVSERGTKFSIVDESAANETIFRQATTSVA
ncbi:MAG: hypothetical protein JSS56_25555, partial [Proteobacteria bacterium]|nr:hypothetical protein [Pseudomonadota bacterium]